MTEQTLPYVIGSETSREAAESMVENAASLRELVFVTIKAGSGLTCDEIEVLLERSHQTVSARIYELKVVKRIVQDGKRRTRSGRRADIHWAVDDDS